MSQINSITRVKFSVGELIHHRLFDYRGVIVDVDDSFQGSEEWYQSVARSRPPKDKPWYHVLVDGAEHTTYVAERNLQADALHEPTDHPLLQQFFSEFKDGKYQRNEPVN